MLFHAQSIFQQCFDGHFVNILLGDLTFEEIFIREPPTFFQCSSRIKSVTDIKAVACSEYLVSKFQATKQTIRLRDISMAYYNLCQRLMER